LKFYGEVVTNPSCHRLLRALAAEIIERGRLSPGASYTLQLTALVLPKICTSKQGDGISLRSLFLFPLCREYYGHRKAEEAIASNNPVFLDNIQSQL